MRNFVAAVSRCSIAWRVILNRVASDEAARLSRRQIKALLSEGVITTRMSLDQMKTAYARHLVMVRRGERPAVLDRELDRLLDRI